MNNVMPRTERPAPISHEVPKGNRPAVNPASERKARRAARNSRRSRIAAQRAMLDRAEYDLKNTTTGQAVDIIEFNSEVGGDVLLLVEEYTRARKDVLGAFPGRPAPSIRQRFARALRERTLPEAEEAQPEEEDMSFKKRTVGGLVADTDHDIGVVGLGAKYARVVGIRARNYASAAKAAAGTDTAQKLKLTDANGDVFFLDAADRDYATAEVTLVPALDDTVTGLGVLGTDATGAVRAAAEATLLPVIEGPVTVTVINGATATDYFEAELLVEV